MKHEYLKPVKCPCCETYYIIKCSHAESASEGDMVCIAFSSKEHIEIRQKKE